MTCGERHEARTKDDLVAYNRRFLVAAFATLAGAAFAAGCGGSSSGPGVASAGTTPQTTVAPTNQHASPLAFSQCMRTHGVADFPDPDSQGRIGIQAGPGTDLNPNNPQFQAAQQACQSLRPPPAPGAGKATLQDGLKFSQCMRAHGLKDFSDPTPAGGGQGITINFGGDLDPNSPTFQAAQKACEHFMGGGFFGQTVTAGGGK
jgi:hypothetical protein